MSIKLLPDYLISQIAAGEIILRPASALKELLENSLDSGATKIEVNIEGGGIESLIVSDNGSGISKVDLPLTLKRHATSKISKFEDLTNLRTFGFRGEALASLSEVSKLKILSQVNDNSSIAYELTIKDREIILNPTTRSVGTTVSISDLFYSLPVRKKFLKTEKSETLALIDVFKSVALTSPNVEFILIHKNRTLLHYNIYDNMGKSLRENRVKAFLKDIDIAIINSINDNNYKIEAWISIRQKPQFRKIIVNNRVVKCLITNQAFRSAINSIFNLPDTSNIPFTQEQCIQSSFVIYIDMPFDSLDINVHPAKEEVKYLENKAIYGLIYNGIFKSFLDKYINKNLSINKQENDKNTKDINVSLDKNQQDKDFLLKNNSERIFLNNQKQKYDINILSEKDKSFFSNDFTNISPITNEQSLLKTDKKIQLDLDLIEITKPKDIVDETILNNEVKIIFTHREYILFKGLDIIKAYKVSDILSEAIIKSSYYKTKLEKSEIIKFPDNFNEINDSDWIITLKSWGFDWHNFGLQAILTHIPIGCEIINWDKYWESFYNNKTKNINESLEHIYIINLCILDSFLAVDILSWFKKTTGLSSINFNDKFFEKLDSKSKIINLDNLLNL